MAGRLAIRRLRLAALAPRDHPAPRSLEMRLAEAARRGLAPALDRALADWSGPEVVRVRRLEVEIAMDAGFDPDLFAALLARAIGSALRRAGGDGVVAYSTRAAYLAALVEALAAGRAWGCWWQREAEGLRALPVAAAIRTALAVDPKIGLEALAILPPLRLAVVLDALGPGEANRLLDEFSATRRGSATPAASIAAIADAASAGAEPSPLALYVRAAARSEAAAGSALAAAARAWAALTHALAGRSEAAAAGFLASLASDGAIAELGPALQSSSEARRVLAQRLARRRNEMPATADAEPDWRFTRFGGLFLLLPTLGLDEIAETVAGVPGPDATTLIGYAALGLCAGRARFGAWLADPLWRELFGLPVQDPPEALAEQLRAIPDRVWETVMPLGDALAGMRDASFLLAPRQLLQSRAARRATARLARSMLTRFARRLAGFRGSSAPFLWHNLLSVTAAVERVGDGGWQARLSRPPLDVLLSLSRLAEGSVRLPSGATVRLTRVSP